MGSIISVLVTAFLGSYLAFRWQLRSSRENRFFEASKAEFDRMSAATDHIATLFGRRYYASHRICRLNTADPLYAEALADFRESIVTWNRELLKIDLDIRTLFKASVTEFESLQQDLAMLTQQISAHLRDIGPTTKPAHPLIREMENLRGRYFIFLQEMIREADALFRQMHFGVRIDYDDRDITLFSTWQLLKALMTGTREELTVTRPPVDFGEPIPARRARLRVD